MAWGRKKSGGRREPMFGLAASLAELRLGPQDRVTVGDEDDEDETPKKPSAKRKARDADDDAPRERKPRPTPVSRARKSKTRSPIGISRLFYWGAVLGLWAAIAVVGVVVWVGAHLPAIQSLEIPKRPPTIQITGLDGSVLATRGEMAGSNVSLKELPPYLPKAFIAIEDRRFYSHYGVDPLGIARAAVANVMHRGVSQGGSTLTQQLAKNLFLTQERTMQRKLQEVELALWLERKHSKTEILELYLNRVYFGSGAYGVEAAAQRYFGKSAKNVTLAEAAMLAGLVKSPSRLAPNRNPEGAEKRAQTVLTAMADAKFITEPQAQVAIGHPSYNVKAAGAGTVNYVADWIGEVLDDLVGQVDQNIVVETSIDPKLQAIAEASIIDELAAKSVKFNVSQGALVAMTPDGAVRAMVGGRNYADSQYNRAVTAKRQPGSAFKPFVYLTAIEAGLTPETIRHLVAFFRQCSLRVWRAITLRERSPFSPLPRQPALVSGRAVALVYARDPDADSITGRGTRPGGRAGRAACGSRAPTTPRRSGATGRGAFSGSRTRMIVVGFAPTIRSARSGSATPFGHEKMPSSQAASIIVLAPRAPGVEGFGDIAITSAAELRVVRGRQTVPWRAPHGRTRRRTPHTSGSEFRRGGRRRGYASRRPRGSADPSSGARRVSRRSRVAFHSGQAAFTPAASLRIDSFASPNSIVVLGS